MKNPPIHLATGKHSFLVPHFIFGPHGGEKKKSRLSTRVCDVSPMKFAGGPGFTNTHEYLRFLPPAVAGALGGPSGLPGRTLPGSLSSIVRPFLFLPVFSALVVSLCFTLCRHGTQWVVAGECLEFSRGSLVRDLSPFGVEEVFPSANSGIPGQEGGKDSRIQRTLLSYQFTSAL